MASFLYLRQCALRSLKLVKCFVFFFSIILKSCFLLASNFAVNQNLEEKAFYFSLKYEFILLFIVFIYMIPAQVSKA
jgi:hypothetical protein